MQPNSKNFNQLDQYAILRRAIVEDEERDRAYSKLLRDRAKARAEKRTASAYRGKPHCKESIGAIMGEADWDAEVYLIDVELFTQESTLP
jgi:hypothetical protein